MPQLTSAQSGNCTDCMNDIVRYCNLTLVYCYANIALWATTTKWSQRVVYGHVHFLGEYSKNLVVQCGSSHSYI